MAAATDRMTQASSKPDERAANAGGLAAFQRARRLVLALLIAAIFSVLLFGQSLFPPDTIVHETLEMLGNALIFCGIVGRLWATLYIGGRKSEAIIVSGPYSITRNPLYVFSTVAAVGVGAQTGSLVAALCVGIFCAAAFHVVILREERHLREMFGAAYADYLRRVPRFWPAPGLYDEGEPSGFRPRLLLTTLLDGMVFLLAAPAFELIDALQQSGILPVLFRMP